MPDVTPAELEGAAREAFAFLEQRPGCHVEVERERWLYTTCGYVFDDVTFEVYLELRSPDVDVRVCRTIDGHPPKPWRVHEGRRIRWPLHEILRRGTEADKLLAADLVKRIRSLPMGKPETMIPAIHIYAPLLREVIDHLPQYYDVLFALVDPPPPAGQAGGRPQ